MHRRDAPGKEPREYLSHALLVRPDAIDRRVEGALSPAKWRKYIFPAGIFTLRGSARAYVSREIAQIEFLHGSLIYEPLFGP